MAPSVAELYLVASYSLYLVRALNSTDRRRRALNSLLTGCCLGMSLLAGGLHIAMAQTIVVVTAILFYAVSRDASMTAEHSIGSSSWRATQVAALTLATAFCAAAIQLLPSHLYASLSIRFLGPYALPSNQMIPYVDVAGGAIWPAGMLSVLFPVFEGIGEGEIWSPYIGVLPFMFACLGVAKCWSRMWVRYLAGLRLAAILYALGGISALDGLLYALVPWLWMAREATRFIYLTGFGLALLAGFGLDAFVRRAIAESFWSSLRGSLTKVIVGCCVAPCSCQNRARTGYSFRF